VLLRKTEFFGRLLLPCCCCKFCHRILLARLLARNLPNQTHFPNQPDAKKLQCRAIIETPKGRRNKFDYDPESGLFELAGLLPEGMAFPFDFGFIPSTLAEGDPVDVMVLMDEPAHVSCLLHVRLIGVIEAEQTQHGTSST
jgi:inorganic pyrophosphatase